MPGKADLHMHTTFSDGILPPRELLQKAVDAGLSAIAITDHDTIDGYLDAQNYIDDFDLELIIGCEFSCYDGGKEYHILGYAFDPEDSQIHRHFENFRKARLLRAKFIHKKLVNLGVDFTFEKIIDKADRAPITRPHFAAVMHEMGYVESLKQAFDLYIGDGGPAYYPKAVFPVANAISMINQAGGVAVLAHPGNYIDPKHPL
jgi:predicted metal-dependent phosphoesterase TrpH